MTGILHKTGDLIGERYRVEGYIGEGGMQEVYLALDILLERQVALKSPKGASAQKRFQRSAIVSARVNQSNVAKTLDYFVDGSRPYLVEELVDGCNLSEFRLQYVKAMDPYSVAKLLHHLSKGVQASHQANVVHRDLKPSNVMVVGGASFVDVKITDFGIAKLAEDEIQAAVEGGGDALTASATALGALPYMAPEMIEEFKSADKPADIWAIGAIAFELLTGSKPFGDGYKAVPKILEAKLPSLPAPIVNSKQFSSLSIAIYDVIRQCIVKDPAQRLNADMLASACGNLCYTTATRNYGRIGSVKYMNQGFIDVDGFGPSVFYHKSTFFNLGIPKVGQRVWFSSYPGSPKSRAFPVVAAEESIED